LQLQYNYNQLEIFILGLRRIYSPKKVSSVKDAPHAKASKTYVLDTNV